MLHSSSFHFRKTKNSPRNHHTKRKLMGRHRLHDLSHIKLADIFKPFRRQRIHRDLPRQPPLRYSQSFPPPIAELHTTLVQPPLSDLSTSASLFTPLCSWDASILSITEEDYSSGTSTPSCSLDGITPDVETLERGVRLSEPPISTFPTSPSAFQLRSPSTEDYLVERLEQHLRHLNLQDASPDQVPSPANLPRDIPMDSCLGSQNVTTSCSSRLTTQSPLSHTPTHGSGQDPTSLPDNQNVVPMIVITSVDAKDAKPLDLPLFSDQRSSRRPFSPSNFVPHPTDDRSPKSKPKTPPDDPFTTQGHGFTFTQPEDSNLTFRLPSFPTAFLALRYAPETPTPMCCNHLGDCRGDLWEILHPPLVAGTFELPPFELPPLGAGLFDDVLVPLPD